MKGVIGLKDVVAYGAEKLAKISGIDAEVAEKIITEVEVMMNPDLVDDDGDLPDSDADEQDHGVDGIEAEAEVEEAEEAGESSADEEEKPQAAAEPV